MALPPITTIPGYICGFGFSAVGQSTPIIEHDFKSENDCAWIWLHLNLADQRCQRWLEKTFRIPASVAVEFSGPSRRQHLSAHGNYLVGHLGDFRKEFDHSSVEGTILHIMLADKLLITGRVQALQSAERLRTDINAGKPFSSPLNMLCSIVSNYVDEIEDHHHDLLEEMEVIEDQILFDRHRSERRRLMLVRRNMAQIHRHLQSYRRALAHAERTLPQYPQALTNPAIRLVNADQDFALLEQRARFFHDEIDAKLAAETNRQLYILSVLTATFLPPTLVAGLFGMNLQGIAWAESPNGFILAIGLSLLSSAAVGLFLWFANRR